MQSKRYVKGYVTKGYRGYMTRENMGLRDERIPNSSSPNLRECGSDGRRIVAHILSKNQEGF